MTRKEHIVHTISVGDTLTPLGVQLKQTNSSGRAVAVDLSGKTVKFFMVHEDGDVKVAESTTGVTVTDAANGKVQKDFAAADVDTEGEYYGWFRVYSGTEFDTFPIGGRKLRIRIISPD